MKHAVSISAAATLAFGLLAPPTQEAAPRELGLRTVLVTHVPEGMQGEARSLALRMDSYYKANHRDEFRAAAYQESNDDFERIFWVWDVPDFKSFEKITTRLSSEEGWAALTEERDRLFETEPIFLLPASATGPVEPEHSFRWWLRLRASYGNYAAALRHARAVADYINANCEGARVEVYRELVSGIGAIHTFSDWKSPDAWRRAQQRLWADEEFLDLMEDAAGLYEDGSWEEGPLARL